MLRSVLCLPFILITGCNNSLDGMMSREPYRSFHIQKELLELEECLGSSLTSKYLDPKIIHNVHGFIITADYLVFEANKEQTGTSVKIYRMKSLRKVSTKSIEQRCLK